MDVDQFVRLTKLTTDPLDADQLIANASSYVALDRTDLALAALGRIGKSRARNTDLLFFDYMAPLRSDPRFIIVAARLGLVAIWRTTNHWPDFCSAPGLPYSCQGMAAKLKT